MKKTIYYLSILLLLSSCGGSGVDVNGEFMLFGDDKLITLEKVVSTQDKIIDSARTKNGKFSFKVNPAPSTPTIFNIKYEQEIIPIIISKGDKIKVKSLGKISQNYKITGSKESALMREIAALMNNGAAELDSLYKVYLKSSSKEDKKQAVGEYRQHYFKIKRQQLAFIMQNKGSIAAVYALYQRLPDDKVLFNGASDALYYSLVADSISVSHPNSPYITMLQNESKRLQMDMPLEYDATITSFPEIQMNDMFGKTHSLSELKGKVIILNFWQSNSEECRLDNAELKQLYERYNSLGLEIFQVAIDTDKHQWISEVRQQELPWISVCDLYGKNSSAVQSYNIKSLPSTFVIDRGGSITARGIMGEELEKLIKKLL